jgi:hypothetical protein
MALTSELHERLVVRRVPSALVCERGDDRAQMDIMVAVQARPERARAHRRSAPARVSGMGRRLQAQYLSRWELETFGEGKLGRVIGGPNGASFIQVRTFLYASY